MSSTQGHSTAIAASAMKSALTGSDSTASAQTSALTVPPKAATTTYSPTGGTVLTVGTNGEFATLSAALNASANGDTILVQAGTYYNDFCTVNTNVTILAMGGVVNEVATVPPPNDKGIILDNANLTIQGFTFTGGSDGSPDGNVAGIRYEAGNLNVQYCDFSNMQEGLLATPVVTGTGTITINASEFSNDGTGDGLSHDIYVGAVASFTLTNSYVHNAIVGHEVKSRAASTTIKNNVIADGVGGDSSYEIDIPNGGVAVISGNTLEKSPTASNQAIIHYGGETQYAWSSNSLTISNNVFDNEYAGGVGVSNQSTVNGLSVSATLTGNSVYGITAGNLIQGAGTASNTHTLTTDPGYSTVQPWTNPPAVALGSGTEVLNLTNANNSVTGGAALFQVTDTGGFNAITGGSGGLRVSNSAGWDTITTQLSTTNTITLSGRNNVVNSAGHDTITDSGLYDQLNVTGPAKITSNNFSVNNLAGSDTISVNAAGVLAVASTGTVSASVGTLGLSLSTLAQGGEVIFSATVTGAIADTIAGASASFAAGNATNLSVTFGTGNALATLGGGNFNLIGGQGNDTYTLVAGAGSLALGLGQDSVIFDAGNDTITASAGLDSFTIAKSNAAGTLVINGFINGIDSLNFTGFTGNAVKTGTVTAAGNTVLTLTDGASVTLNGTALPGYPVAGSGGSSSGSSGGSSGGGTLVGSSNSITLTSGGQSIAGGTSLLTITDGAGGNTISGGSGGITGVFLLDDVITTSAGAPNSLALSGGDTFFGGGGDTIAATGRYNIINDAGKATLSLGSTNNTVQGGAGLLTINDAVGSNDIIGGAGGLLLTGSSTYQTITTAAAASDNLSIGGYSTLTLNGTDTINLSGNYSLVTAYGADLILANGGPSSFDLEGNDTLQGTAPGFITVGGAANDKLISTGQGGSYITKNAGGTLSLTQTMSNGSVAAVTVTGGAATLSDQSGNYGNISVATSGQGNAITIGLGPVIVNSAGNDTIWAGIGAATINGSGAMSVVGGSGTLDINAGSAGISVQAGSGNITLQGGQGNDSFTGGTGNALLTLGAGNDSITFGGGTSFVFAGSNDVFNIIAGVGSNDTISGWSAGDQLNFQGYGTASAILTQSVTSGNTYLTLTDGTQITLLNTAQQF